MTELLSDITTPSDAELISSVRGGDVAAYGELFARHKDAANRLARQLVRGPDSDDLVSEAFAKVLSVLQGGGGPDVAFRAYLLTAVRRLHVDRIRASAKVQPSEDMSEFDGGIPFQDTAVAAFESGAAAKAFATLPERWQLVLWHLEVEGQKPADIAPLLGMSPNSVSALAYRAREGLRQAFLTMHLNDTSETDCRWVNEHLGAYVRKGLSNRDATKVRSHLDQCRRCTAMYLELTEVNSNLAGILAPLLLGGAATGYLASTGAAAGGFGVAALFGRVRDVVSANAGAATAAGVAAGVAAVATAGVLLLPSGGEQVAAIKDPAANASSAVPTPPSAAAASPTEAPQQKKSVAAEPDSDDEAETDETPDDESTTEPAVATVPGPAAGDPAAPGGSDTPADEAQEPGSPGSVTSDVGFSSPVSFDGDAVSFTVAGDPLPPTIGLELVSDPAGIEFRENGSACTLTSATTADCSTGALARGGFAMGRGMALAPRAFTGSIRLRIPADQPDSEVRFVVSVPKGYTDPSDPESNASSFQYKPRKATPPAEPGTPGTPPGSTSPGTTPPATPPTTPTTPNLPVDPPPVDPPPVDPPPVDPPPVDPPPVDPPPVDPPPVLTADVILGLPILLPLTPAKDGTYAVAVRVSATATSGPAFPTVRLTVSSAVTIASAPDGCALDPATPAEDVLCPATATPTDVRLHLAAVSPVIVPTDVTISAAAPPDYDEPVDRRDDNARVVTLLPAPDPEANASVKATIDAQGNSGKGTATVNLTIDPDVPVSLALGYDPKVVTVQLPVECSPIETGATCLLTRDAELKFPVAINDRPGGETVTATIGFTATVLGHIDPVPDDNSASVTITREFDKSPQE